MECAVAPVPFNFLPGFCIRSSYMLCFNGHRLKGGVTEHLGVEFV